MSTLSPIHETAKAHSADIGYRSKVGEFVIIHPSAKIGNDTNIHSHCHIDDSATIGDRVTIKSGVYISEGALVGDDVFIGPNVTLSTENFPSSILGQASSKIHIQNGASIYGGAVILAGVSIGTGAVVEAGAVVTRSVPPFAVVSGSPAKINGYVETQSLSIDSQISSLPPSFSADKASVRVGIGDVTLHRFKLIRDMRGDLSVGEFLKDIPFSPKRYFLVYDVPSEKTRGEHAHHKCHQFLICVRGHCAVVVDDGKNRTEIPLDSPDKGIYLPPLTWGVQYKYSSDALLLVFTSDYYEAEDYIRDYSEFIKIAQCTPSI